MLIRSHSFIHSSIMNELIEVWVAEIVYKSTEPDDHEVLTQVRVCLSEELADKEIISLFRSYLLRKDRKLLATSASRQYIARPQKNEKTIPPTTTTTTKNKNKKRKTFPNGDFLYSASSSSSSDDEEEENESCLE